MDGCKPIKPHLRRLGCIVMICAMAALTTGASGCLTSLPDYVRNGFKVGPNYKAAPPAPLTERWIDETNPRVAHGDPNLAAWWEVFDDPVLNLLIQRAYDRNLTVRAAGYQILQARAQRAIAIGLIFPQSQTATWTGTHSLISGSGGFNAGAIAGAGAALAPATGAPNLGASIGGSSIAFGAGSGRNFNNWSTANNLSWELDFWGLFRRNFEAADASLEQSIYNRDEAVVLLLADVASRYVEYRTLQRRLDLARKNVAQQQPIVDILFKRYKAGIADADTGYFQLKSNLDNTKALIPPLETALRVSNNQLCILLGMPVRDLRPELGDGTIPDPANPKNRIVHIPRPKNEAVVVGIPAELLLRRPDVRAAERILKNKSAQIGLAEAQMYPHMGLNGNIGLAANNVLKLYNPPSWAGGIGPSISWNILNYGRLLGNVRYQNFVFQQYVAQYQNTVLTANQESESALVSYINSLDQAFHLKNSSEAAAKVTNYQFTRYKEGRVPGGDPSQVYNLLFTTSNFQVSQQDAAAQAEGNIALNLIQLYKALGGGWQIRGEHPVPACLDPGPDDYALPFAPLPDAAATLLPPRPQFGAPRPMEDSPR